MEKFPELKALYFEGNGLEELSGLETNTALRCLYVHENCISKIEGLDNLCNLANLNLSDNMISKVENLAGCTNLDMCYLARNRIGRNGLDDLRGLLECPSITTLDLQNNKIDDPEVLDEIFVNMPNLKVLYLQNNGCIGKIRNYRKTVIAKLPNLKYLDDRPVFDDDRRNAEAFARGGMEEERAERARIGEEKKARDDYNRLTFKEMIARARAEKAAKDLAEGRSASPAENGVTDNTATQNRVKEDNNKFGENFEEIKKQVADINTAYEASSRMIDTTEEGKQAPCEVYEVDDDAPPELETVEADQLKAEQAAASSDDKQHRQMYDQLRKNVGQDDDDSEEEEEGCTVEEVKTEEPAMQAQPAAEEPESDPIADVLSGKMDPLAQMAELVKQAE